jgi:hypothetical protein
MHVFDPESRVSLFGATYRYTFTHSQIFSAFARTSSGDSVLTAPAVFSESHVAWDSPQHCER